MSTGLIADVVLGGLADRVGLRPRDELISINGHRLRDVIDVQIHAAEEHLTLTARRDGQDFDVAVDRQYGEPLGLEFTAPTFDPIRRCGNHCEFCFVVQMPRGLRPSLYFKDDDYRYSFLFGNYITLTNLEDGDWNRIGQQHLSPLYVSVHVTDLDLRRRILGDAAAPDVMVQLRRLSNLGIEVHTQIVVIPGLNDGRRLDSSIRDLAGLYPAVCSVSVVPVGLTKYHRGGCRTHTDAEARTVFDQVAGWQGRLRERLGVSLVYLSDEWYLRLREDVPPLADYDGLDLTENGVGLVRQFLEDEAQRPRARIVHLRSVAAVTGTLFAPVLQRVTAHLPGFKVVPVPNRFFGETVTVAGLLTVQDVVTHLQGRELSEIVALPPAMFGGPDRQSLDGMRPQDVAEALGRQVLVEDGLKW